MNYYRAKIFDEEYQINTGDSVADDILNTLYDVYNKDNLSILYIIYLMYENKYTNSINRPMQLLLRNISLKYKGVEVLERPKETEEIDYMYNILYIISTLVDMTKRGNHLDFDTVIEMQSISECIYEFVQDDEEAFNKVVYYVLGFQPSEIEKPKNIQNIDIDSEIVGVENGKNKFGELLEQAFLSGDLKF